jgi:hypothetical protein
MNNSHIPPNTPQKKMISEKKHEVVLAKCRQIYEVLLLAVIL